MSGSGRRSLAAVMFTDVVGYSSLTQRNESLALELLEEHRKVVRSILAKNNGREIKTIGDAFLVEFSSAFEALQCALEIQNSLKYLNSSRASEAKIRLRIGIHLGDVIRNDSDILGDAVNIASRIEPLAEPGGICISEQVYTQVRNKFQAPMIRLENVQLKNIDSPIGIYRIVMSEGDPSTKSVLPSNRIAILPFVNISPDPSDEYFSDGLTEELIANVSRIKSLKVIARTSVMNYKGKGKSVTQIGKELNTGSIVEGSVRKSGNKIRVTVQLIDANNEEHLWAENFDKQLDDIFEIQSEISAKVAESLASNLVRPKSLEASVETENVTTYAVYLRANQLRYLDQDKPVREALKLLDEVVVESSNYARAYVSMAECWLSLANIGSEPFHESALKAKVAVTKALDIDPNLPEALTTLAEVFWALDDTDSMYKVLTKTIALNENQANAHLFLGGYYLAKSQLRNAATSVEKAYELNPLSRRVTGYLGMVYFYLGRDEDALSVWRRVLQMFPSRLTIYELLLEYYLSKGDSSAAMKELEAGLQAVEDDEGKTVLQGYVYAITNDRSNVEMAASKLEKRMKSGTVILNHIGYMYFILKDNDKFFEYMFRSAEAHSLGAFQLRYSPLFEPIRRDSRYFELMKKVNFDP